MSKAEPEKKLAKRGRSRSRSRSKSERSSKSSHRSQRSSDRSSHSRRVRKPVVEKRARSSRSSERNLKCPKCGYKQKFTREQLTNMMAELEATSSSESLSNKKKHRGSE